MATTRNGASEATERQQDVWNGVTDPSGKIRLAQREKNFQQRLEKIQVALHEKDIRYKKTVARGLKELVNARKMDELMTDKNIKSIADFSHLKEIYESDLEVISSEDLSREAKAKAEAFLTSGNKVTPQQEKVVREFYNLEAKTNLLGIEHVREFLIIKGEIAETQKDRQRIHQKERLAEELAA